MQKEVIPMRCPSCGEPIQSSHTFCVICGTDLERVIPRPVQHSLRTAAKSLRSLLTMPIGPRKQEPALVPASMMHTVPPEQRYQTGENIGQSVIAPDFMHPFLSG